MPNLPIDFTSLILAIVTVVAILLYLHELMQKKTQRTPDWDNLHDSIKKADAIIGKAEIEGIKILAESKLGTSIFETEYEKKLSELLNESQKVITSAQGQLLEFMQDLQKRSEGFEEAQKVSGEQRINQLFDRVESRLADFLIQTEQKTASSIELELKAARQLVDIYKSEQLKLIDENILAMMEQTLSIVLAKKLSLKDQLDLIYEALEKAKVEKFIV